VDSESGRRADRYDPVTAVVVVAHRVLVVISSRRGLVPAGRGSPPLLPFPLISERCGVRAEPALSLVMARAGGNVGRIMGRGRARAKAKWDEGPDDGLSGARVPIAPLPSDLSGGGRELAADAVVEDRGSPFGQE
jgi:hypothetical protein